MTTRVVRAPVMTASAVNAAAPVPGAAVPSTVVPSTLQSAPFGTRVTDVLRRGAHLVLRLPGLLLLGLLWVYQRFVSPLTPPSCRYYPSCSQYAVIAVRRHGALRGTWLAVRRLGRCHPWAAGGVDDVPPVRARHDHGSEHVDRARSSAR